MQKSVSFVVRATLKRTAKNVVKYRINVLIAANNLL